jgi:hypothetical protein
VPIALIVVLANSMQTQPNLAPALANQAGEAMGAALQFAARMQTTSNALTVERARVCRLQTQSVTTVMLVSWVSKPVNSFAVAKTVPTVKKSLPIAVRA